VTNAIFFIFILQHVCQSKFYYTVKNATIQYITAGSGLCFKSAIGYFAPFQGLWQHNLYAAKQTAGRFVKFSMQHINDKKLKDVAKILLV
jgi:hypothetical protein